MADFGRKIITIVEIEMDYCGLTFGMSPCTAAIGASGHKCFNTRKTCQDVANYDLSSKVLRYAYNQDGLPKGQTIYPALRSVSTSALRINPNGIDAKYGPLGKREKISITLQDFTDSDTYTDKYQSERISGTAQTDEGPYSPKERGTHFTKLRARNPFYIGRSVRVLEGVEGDALADMRTRNYIISKWVGPDASGRVQIEAKDVLDLVENEKAVAPAQNQGYLETDIGTGTLTFNLLPDGVGSEYEASGRASIGSEIVTFTRLDDAITLTGRGLDGTSEESHADGDTFQQCYRVENVHILDVIADLLENYSEIDANFIPDDVWASEYVWLAGFDLTCTIPKPTGVKDLLAEICQLGVMLWWDGIDQEIKVRAVRPAGYDEEYQTITDDANSIEGSIKVTDKPDERLSRVRVYHGITDSGSSHTDESNYDVCEIRIDQDAEGNAQHSISQEKVIFMRWLGSGQTSITAAVASRLVSRYRDIPQEFSFSVDYKDKDKIPPAGLVQATSRVLVGETGANAPTSMQVISSQEVQAGHEFKVIAQTFTYDGRFGFTMQDSANDYDSATDLEKEKGCYIVDSGLDFGDGSTPYEVF